jgi:hypothetical protein
VLGPSAKQTNVDGSIVTGHKVDRPPRTIDLLAPLRQDLTEYLLTSGRRAPKVLLIPRPNGKPWRAKRLSQLAPLDDVAASVPVGGVVDEAHDAENTLAADDALASARLTRSHHRREGGWGEPARAVRRLTEERGGRPITPATVDKPCRCW